MNAPESTQPDEHRDPEASAAPEPFTEGAEPAEPSQPAEDPGDGSAESGATDRGSADTSIYVRRRRAPTLGFWVTLAIAAPALVALVITPFFDFPDLGGALSFVLLVAAFIGIPLAAIVAGVDSFLQRRAQRGRR